MEHVSFALLLVNSDNQIPGCFELHAKDYYPQDSHQQVTTTVPVGASSPDLV